MNCETLRHPSGRVVVGNGLQGHYFFIDVGPGPEFVCFGEAIPVPIRTRS